MGFPFDGSLGIGGSINIVCKDRLWETFQREVCFGQKANVDEISSGATVNDGSSFNGLDLSN